MMRIMAEPCDGFTHPAAVFAASIPVWNCVRRAQQPRASAAALQPSLRGTAGSGTWSWGGLTKRAEERARNHSAPSVIRMSPYAHRAHAGDAPRLNVAEHWGSL
jgi:hypothetical protein